VWLTPARSCCLSTIGFSNGPSPTTIFRDPIDNIPVEVRPGALAAVRRSLNVRNRPSKEARFGFSTSEDALSWTVFSWLAGEAPSGLARLAERLSLGSGGAPAMLLWGVPIDGSGGRNLRNQLIDVLDALGERPDSRTEPDVVLDYGERGVVLIEVKFRAGNDVQREENAYKFDLYSRGTRAFASPEGVTRTRHYELARNWRVAHDLATGRPYRVVNLGPPSLFSGPAGTALSGFEAALAGNAGGKFERLTWAAFLADIRAANGPLPAWLERWLSERGISP
jgi:hypothetical protein